MNKTPRIRVSNVSLIALPGQATMRASNGRNHDIVDATNAAERVSGRLVWRRTVLLAIALWLVGTGNGSAQLLQWAKQASGTAFTDFTQSYAIAVDGSGNTHVMGLFKGTSTFGRGEANETTVTSTSPNFDLFVAKYDGSGKLLWVKQIAGGLFSIGSNGLAVDSSGNTYVTGSFARTAVFSPGGANVSLTSSGCQDCFDGFSAKYGSDGALTWVNTFRFSLSGNDDFSNAIAVDDVRGIGYVTGAYEETNPISDKFNVFLGRFRTGDGTDLGSSVFPEALSQSGSDLALDPSGNIYVTGYRETLRGDKDIYTLKIDASTLSVVWAVDGGSGGEDEGTSIAVDKSGNVYVTGTFEFSPADGGANIFVSKMDNNGAQLWLKLAGGPGSGADTGLALVVDDDGNSYVTGYFHGPATFGKGEANETVLALPCCTDSQDFFIAKYAGDGALAWAIRAGGPDDDLGNGIALDGAGDIYVTGSFQSEFGPFGLSTKAAVGAFVAKFRSHSVCGDGVVEIGEPCDDGNTAGGDGCPATCDAVEPGFVCIGQPSICMGEQPRLLEWATPAGGTHVTEGTGVAADRDGNSYVTGFFFRTATFGRGQPAETTLTAQGVQDIFVAKYDARGRLVWAKRGGGAGTEIANGIAVDRDGNSYVTGFFLAPATFGSGEPNETTLTPTTSGSSDLFVAKYDGDGRLVWAKRAGGAEIDVAYGIAVDANGDSYVTGYFNGEAIFGSQEPNETTLRSESHLNDVFVAKYASDGRLVWAKAAMGKLDEAHAITVDADGNSYVTGFFGAPTVFGANEPNETTLVPAGIPDVFVAKYTNSGLLEWAKRAGGAGNDQGYGIAVDSSGRSYVTGIFDGPATFGAGESNETTLDSGGVFIAQYEGDGRLGWAKRTGGTVGRAIAVDQDGNPYVTGSFFFRNATFGEGEAHQTTLPHVGESDIFVAKHTSSGLLVWARAAGGDRAEEGLGIAVDGTGKSHVTGYFSGTSTFGRQEPNETILTAEGATDMFLAKFFSGACGDGVTDSDEECDDGNATDGDGCTRCKDDCANPVTDCATAAQCRTAVCTPTKGGGAVCGVADQSGTPCNDGNACTTGDVCSAGVCVSVPLDCNDHQNCTIDTCNPTSGCVHAPVTCNGIRATICGTDANDTIVNKTNKKQVIAGLGGNDTISAGNGGDVICGGDGNDVINGGNGRDALYGENGDDVLRGNNGDDLLSGGAGNDTLAGDAGNDQLDGGIGTDRCTGGPGIDTGTNCEPFVQ